MEVLARINEKFSSEPFSEWYIDRLFWINSNDDGKYADIIRKYGVANSTSTFKLDDQDAETVLSLYEPSQNILVRCFLSYLLSKSKLRDKSQLKNGCVELIGLFFENISDIDGGLPFHNLLTVLIWTLNGFPETKNQINALLQTEILKDRGDKRAAVKTFSLVNSILCDKSLTKLFTFEQYKAYFDKFYECSVEKAYIHVYFDFYKTYLAYLKEKNGQEHKDFLKKYCDFALNGIDSLDSHSITEIYPDVRLYMDRVGSYTDSGYQIVDTHLEDAGKKILDGMERHIIELPPEQQTELKQFIEKQNAMFESLANDEKIDELLFELRPISKDEIQKQIKENKGVFSNFVEESFVESDGTVIYCSKLNDEDKFSLKARQHIGILVGIYGDTLLNPFFNSFCMDESAERFIKSMLEGNRLIPPEKKDYMFGLIQSFFSHDFQHSVYDLCEELEDCLRYYFKKTGMNVRKRNSSGDYVGLSGFFNNNQNNLFREKLLETIDEDFYFTLKWFLVDDYGFGLRNRIAHRYNSKDLYKQLFSVFASAQIIRLIWGFQNNDCLE